MTTTDNTTDTQQPTIATPAKKNKPFVKYLVLYLVLTLGSVWGLTIFFLANYDLAVSIFGELSLTNPVVMIILHSPAIAALIILLMYDGVRGVVNFVLTLIPRKRDLIWLVVLALIMVAYVWAVRVFAMLFGVDVPPEPIAPLDMFLTFLSMFILEIGMLAITMGWFGFFMPMMHRLTGNHVISGIATGLGIGLFVAPGNLFSSFELATAWPLYVTQLSVLCIGMSFLLSKMKGNVLFFLIPFWVSASGSWLSLYFFNTPTQLVQLVLFTLLVLALYVVLKWQARKEGRELDKPFVFPDYLEQAYTEEMEAVIPGRGNKSREILAAHYREIEA